MNEKELSNLKEEFLPKLNNVKKNYEIIKNKQKSEILCKNTKISFLHMI